MTSPPRCRSHARWLAGLSLMAALAGAIGVRGEQRPLTPFVFRPEYTDKYSQNVFGVSDHLRLNLGGVVVLQNGDVIAGECAVKDARLHRFRASVTDVEEDTPVHPDEIILNAAGGCGIALHPDGYIYSNVRDLPASVGVVKIQIGASAATVVDRFAVPTGAGNGGGIAVDPITGNLLYTDAGCTSIVGAYPTCNLIEITTDGAEVRRIPLPMVTFGGGVSFDPTGAFLFVTDRPAAPGTDSQRELVVLDRTTNTVVQTIVIPGQPVGIAFSATTPKFILTNNQDSTITRLDFPGDDYRLPPAVSLFAERGFRGDLVQAGPDGCLYVTQAGVNYNNGDSETGSHGSIVQICEGFAPPPGVTPDPPPPPSSLCGVVYSDANNDGSHGGSELGIGGVALSLQGIDTLNREVTRSVSTAADGAYCFNDLKAGTYTITESQPAGYFDGPVTVGTAGGSLSSTSGQVIISGIALAAGIDGRNYDFGELAESSLGGYVYVDANDNGIREASEAPIAGVQVTLSSPGTGASMIAVTGTDGSYMFGALRPGSYTLTETQPNGYADGKDTSHPPTTTAVANDTFAVVLAPGTNSTDNNFGETAAAPRVGLVVTTNGTDNNSGTGPSIFVGSTVTWSYDIQNTGNVALSNLTLADNKAGTVVCPATTIPANSSITCIKTGTAVAGQYINTATVTATDPFGTTVTAQSGDRYLGVADKAKPTCVVKTYKGPPFRGTMTFQDTGSGLASLTVTTNTNFKVTMPAFTRGTTTAVTVSATRVDEKKSAQLVIKAVDVAGNAMSCDPVVTTVTKLRQDNGNQTFTGIPYAEHIVTVVNGKPGLRRLNVEVNGVMFAVKKLDDNETQVIDIESAMRRGTNNTITLIPKGRKGESAEVTIADQ